MSQMICTQLHIKTVFSLPFRAHHYACKRKVFLFGYDEQKKKWSAATVEIPTDALFQIGKSAAAFQRHNKV